MSRLSLYSQRDGVTTVMVVVLCALLFAVISCSSDDGPVGTGGGTLPNEEGIPPIPVLSSPNDDPPERSTTLSLAKPAYTYMPQIVRGKAVWRVAGYAEYEDAPFWVNCTGDARDLYNWDGSVTTEIWNDAIPDATGCFDGCGISLPHCPASWQVKFYSWPTEQRFAFVWDGQAVSNPEMVWEVWSETLCRVTNPCRSKVRVFSAYVAEGKPLEKVPHLRRDRFWVAKEWESGAVVHRITGDNETRMKTQYTTGCDNTQTESFAYTLGASFGADYNGLSGTIEASITKTFTTSITVSEQTMTSVEKILRGDAGMITCHIMWVLVERYTFVDENGDRLADPNYVFTQGFQDPVTDTWHDFEITGTQEHVAKYVFDDTGALLEVSIVE